MIYELYSPDENRKRFLSQTDHKVYSEFLVEKDKYFIVNNLYCKVSKDPQKIENLSYKLIDKIYFQNGKKIMGKTIQVEIL